MFKFQFGGLNGFNEYKQSSWTDKSKEGRGGKEV